MGRALAPARVILGNRGFLGLLGCNILLGLGFSFVSPFMSLFGEHEVGMSPGGLRRVHDPDLPLRHRPEHDTGALVGYAIHPAFDPPPRVGGGGPGLCRLRRGPRRPVAARNRVPSPRHRLDHVFAAVRPRPRAAREVRAAAEGRSAVHERVPAVLRAVLDRRPGDRILGHDQVFVPRHLPHDGDLLRRPLRRDLFPRPLPPPVGDGEEGGHLQGDGPGPGPGRGAWPISRAS